MILRWRKFSSSFRRFLQNISDGWTGGSSVKSWFDREVFRSIDSPVSQSSVGFGVVFNFLDRNENGLFPQPPFLKVIKMYEFNQRTYNQTLLFRFLNSQSAVFDFCDHNSSDRVRKVGTRFWFQISRHEALTKTQKIFSLPSLFPNCSTDYA